MDILTEPLIITIPTRILQRPSADPKHQADADRRDTLIAKEGRNSFGRNHGLHPATGLDAPSPRTAKTSSLKRNANSRARQPTQNLPLRTIQRGARTPGAMTPVRHQISTHCRRMRNNKMRNLHSKFSLFFFLCHV